jgi:hypothetical protein
MKAIATKQPTNESVKQNKSGEKGRSRSISPLSTGMPLLQRKCACGGGCPRCKKSPIQTKLKISEPGDKYEQEADRIADEVMRMPELSVQRQIEPKKVYRAITNPPTILSPSEDKSSLSAEQLPSGVETSPIGASLEEKADGNSDSSPNGQDICRGTQDIHSTLIFLGTFPPALVAEFGEIFDPIQRAIDNNRREMGLHFPILNNKPLLNNSSSTVANLINGVEPGTEQDAIVKCKENRCRAFFNPANQPQRNLAESYVVLPPSGILWKKNNADASKVANWIDSDLVPNKVPIDESKGTIDDCRNRTKSINVLFSLEERIQQIVEKHEKRHAKDWGKVFCRVIGRRDRQVSQRTGSNNAKIGLALNNPLKAKERALKKLFNGIDTKLEAAQKLMEFHESKKNQLHSTTRLNSQMKNLAIGSRCEGVILNIEPQSRGNEAPVLTSDSDFLRNHN